ncbi:hypothetical protein C2845_PM17G12590 [Panicum miliaceum]|uniref:KIB1-4 beta-propeller domain-containing protein n=1 Tax=Panicum miliaceum TaxID=4540 RepID=A0A3L6PYT0_PANMI|nr:hypothetical protein C2845_PM17G12590 [Panicum miliaceum]
MGGAWAGWQGRRGWGGARRGRGGTAGARAGRQRAWAGLGGGVGAAGRGRAGLGGGAVGTGWKQDGAAQWAGACKRERVGHVNIIEAPTSSACTSPSRTRLPACSTPATPRPRHGHAPQRFHRRSVQGPAANARTVRKSLGPPAAAGNVAMEQATEDGSGSSVIAGRDWSGLPEELLVSFLLAMDVPAAVRSGAVCTSWNAAYAAFRRLRAPSPRQLPCLLYASDALAPGAAALHCPATGATLQIPFLLAPLARQPLLGSGHGWLVTANEASNLHLLNPVTGAQAALPPVTALHNVKMGTDERGGPAYAVYEPGSEPNILEIGRAHDYMYDRVVLLASPSTGRACVVLLLHMPMGEVSFARLGDDCWTWVAPGGGTGLPWRCYYEDAMYSDIDSLFYLVRMDSSIVSLDLNGSSPVARKILDGVPKSSTPTKYMLQTPAGDILQIWRLKDYVV